jgi:hypothetical protein
MRVVVTGLLAAYPLGGVAWDYLAFVQGFRRFGAEVLYLEDTGQWLYDPSSGSFTDDVSTHTRYLAGILAARAPGVAWSLRDPRNQYHGMDELAVHRFCSSADLFLNVSGCCWLRDGYRGARRTIYLDTDPGYSQAKLAAAERGTATGDELYSVDLIHAHDLFFTFAENYGRPSCRLPAAGLSWKTTRQPIVLEDWPISFSPQAKSYTTVMSWKTDVTPPTIDGTSYGGKDVELRRFLELPRRTGVTLELALAGKAPREELLRHGWHLVDANEKSSTMNAYRDYLASSRGEWSVAKNAYVATRSGWFSCRTACYLALGKPVVVQDTGFSEIYPTGAGLFAFSTLEEAMSGLDQVESDYARHCEAARAVAESEFAAEKVLAKLCRDVGL